MVQGNQQMTKVATSKDGVQGCFFSPNIVYFSVTTKHMKWIPVGNQAQIVSILICVEFVRASEIWKKLCPFLEGEFDAIRFGLSLKRVTVTHRLQFSNDIFFLSLKVRFFS